MSNDQAHEIGKTSIEAMNACIKHANDLLASAKAVHAAGHPHVAYHLTTLALEEIGRRALIGLQALTATRDAPPSWPSKHSLDHVKKLFWAFFSANFLVDRLDGKQLEAMTQFAKSIHAKRLAGLYLEHDDGHLSIPADAITVEESYRLLDLAGKRLDLAQSEKLNHHFTEEDVELQHWFLNITDAREKRLFIFSKTSLSKLGELKNARSWIHNYLLDAGS